MGSVFLFLSPPGLSRWFGRDILASSRQPHLHKVESGLGILEVEMGKSQNITWHAATVTMDERESFLQSRGCVLWLTGLSGSGKSTIARALEKRLVSEGRFAYVLDGDNVRHGLNGDLGFAPKDRTENIRRVGEVAKLFSDACLLVIASFISPYRSDRDGIRAKLPEGRFIEVHIAAPLDECEKRDPKGLYARARSGEITQFTGISAPYEAPLKPELVLHTEKKTVEACVEEVVCFLRDHGFAG
jgi:adenylylsulfate kinase